MKLSKILLLSILLLTNLYSINLNDFFDKNKCDQIIDKQLYQICYSYENKGALAGWVTLYGDKVNEVNIKKRPRFYTEKNLSAKYRTKYKDYTGYGKDWNRGHFIVSDADFDYDKKALKKAYTMAQIQPQSAKVNQRTWIKVEKYGRSLAKKLGHINSITIADYRTNKGKIKNDIVIPGGFYRIYYNNDSNFKKCFYYKNDLNIDTKKDKLKNHIIECSSIRY